MNIKRFCKDRISDCAYVRRKLTGANSLKSGNCRILMYHAIENSDSKDTMGLAVSPAVFRMHMKYLKENGFCVLDLCDYIDKIRNRRPIAERSVVVTFDDGYRSILTGALPVLKECEFPATLFVNIYFVERKVSDGRYYNDWQVLTWDEIRRLKTNGVAIGSHGLTHRRLTSLDGDVLGDEIAKSKEIIEKNIRDRIYSFSYPHGAFNEKVKEILKKENFICSCSSVEGVNDIRSDMFALKRTEITAFDNTPIKFEKKLSGSYDWVGCIKSYG